MDKGSEFPRTALKNLNELLEDANSQVQRAWYHNELMILNILLDDIASAEVHAREIVSVYENLGHPDYMLGFHFAFVMCGNIKEAIEMAIRYPNMLDEVGLFKDIFIQNYARSVYLYNRLGYGEVFQEFTRQIQQNMPEILCKAGLSELVVEPTVFFE